VRIALSGVGRLSGRFGVARIAQVLTGSQVREVLDRGLDKVPTYGKLAGTPIEEVKALLDALAEAGLLERHGIEGGRPGAFVLALTPAGREVAMGKTRPELALPSRVGTGSRGGKSGRRPRAPSAPAHQPSGAPDSELLSRLKAWRTDEARRRGVPAYAILHDRTLAAFAAVRPRDRATLLGIPGIGPAKLEAYGEALLRFSES
jgi:ATP-dependent DNA helicase RecQ